MRTFVTIVIFFLTFDAIAQKHDSNWLLGGTCGSSEEFRLAQLDFCKDDIEPEVLPQIRFFINPTNSSQSDKEGNLLFYTNGNDIFNWKNELMENGANLAGEGDCGHQSTRQGAISMPYPGRDSQYVLVTINDEILFLEEEIAVFQNVYFNHIDMQQNNSEGSLVVRQDLILGDTLNIGQGMVCQHANGRDWWLLMFEFNSTEYYRFLITPEGYKSYGKASVNIPVISGRSQSVYSPDGEYLALFNAKSLEIGTYIDIFKFNRCEGLLNDQIQILYNDQAIAGGVAFSPNSKFLYVSSFLNVYQYDMWAENIETSRVKVAEYDGFREDNIYATPFNMAMLAPNDKIYISTDRDGHFLHVINNPNEKGLACNLEQHALEWPTWKHISIPNFPHYRMGVLEGSLCDTIGFVDSPFANFTFEKTGTPNIYQFEDKSTSNVEQWSWDFGDGNNSNEQDPLHEYSQFGSFEVCLTVTNQAGSNASCQRICVLPEPDMQDYIAASSMVLDCALENQEIDLSTLFLDLNFAHPDDWLISWLGPNDFSQSGIDQLSIDEPGVYYLSIQDTTSSCMISDSIIIEEDNLALEFSLSQDSAFLFCNELVELDLIIDSDCFEVRWQRPDGNIFNAYSTTEFKLSTTGLYTFYVKDCNNDCEAERTFVIERIPLSALWTTEMNGTEVTFIPETTGVNFFHIWRFGDGNFSAFESPMHTYESPGTYEVIHEVLDGCESYFSTQEIVVVEDVVDPPSSTFLYDNQNSDFNFSFEDTSIGEVDAWLWEFGDGNTSIEQNPNHEYAKYGSYEVCLTVTNIVDSDTYCETICVLPDLEQLDLITASDTILNCTNIDDGILLSSSILLSDFYNSEDWLFEWAINGGSASIDNSIRVTIPGFIAFTFRDTSSNCSLSTSIEITEDFTTPNFELSTDLDSIPCGSSFELYIDADTNCFEVIVFHENLAPILFSMDDTLTIDGAGTYTVELRDCSSGCTSIQQFSIENESITAAWTSEELGAEFSFVSDQTSGIDHQWDFGDGGMSEEPNPGHTFTSSGTYQITHIVSNACGSDTLQQSVNVIISSTKTLAEGSVQVFPNPTSDDLNIRSTVGDIVQVKLYSSLGQLQMDERVQTSEVLVSVQDYRAGVYWLHVELLDGRSWTERLVILGGE